MHYADDWQAFEGKTGAMRFARQGELDGRELVTTFGHGAHYCPAARFSISHIRSSVTPK